MSDYGSDDPAETVYFDRALTPEEMRSVDDYLRAKWQASPRREPSQPKRGEWTPAKLPNLKVWMDATDPGATIIRDGKVVAVIDKATRRGRARCWIRRCSLKKQRPPTTKRRRSILMTDPTRLSDEQVATWAGWTERAISSALAREVQQWRALIPEVIEELEWYRNRGVHGSDEIDAIIAKLREASQ